MRIPVIRGIIDRRLLVNYRVDPDVMADVLPAPFSPKVVDGYAIGGICLIRLKKVRPKLLPIPFGIRSENAAHRIAVEWLDNGVLREGVYIPRRDTDSRLNTLAGGRVFPGLHHHATFTIDETNDHFSVSLQSHDDKTRLHVSARLASDLPASSVFSSLAQASAFFEAGSLGYSATPSEGRYDGLELRCTNWNVEPLDVEEVQSTFFGDQTRFPAGSVEFDCALLMRGIDHEWHSREELCSPTAMASVPNAAA
ncbi:MAG: DUF2071 domain-containing protein [Ardenticatenaceae bacterium]